MVWSFDDKEPYDDPAVAALREKASELGLELRLTHLGTRGQLAFAVPVDGLDYWRASLHAEGKRGAVVYELRNTAREAAQAVLMTYENQRRPKPPQERRVFAAAASIRLPAPAAQEMRAEMENPPEPYHGPGNPGESWAIRIHAAVFALVMIAIIVIFVVATR